MPRFQTNIYNDDDTIDEEGAEFSGLPAARESALAGIRELIADHVRPGRPLNLNHRAEIADDEGAVVAVTSFRDAMSFTDEAEHPSS